jgi:hypothetical protein
MSIVQDNVNAELDRIDRIHNRCLAATLTAMVAIVAVSMFLLLTGCASTHKGGHLPYAGPAPSMTGTVQRAAVCIGVLSTRGVYGGQFLLCPGADVDMQIAAGWCQAAGITNVTTLLSFQATRGAVVHAINAAVAGFDGPEDLVIVTLSSHGGRVPDYSGDEPSGYDSTWCLADGPWVDDAVWIAIQQLPPCRILFVADTCHAEGSFRRFIPFLRTAHPVDVGAKAGTWGGTVVQFAACREAESALGGSDGGQWHISLDVERQAATDYADWFGRARGEVEDQTPTMATYGHPDAIRWFLERRPME